MFSSKLVRKAKLSRPAVRAMIVVLATRTGQKPLSEEMFSGTMRGGMLDPASLVTLKSEDDVDAFLRRLSHGRGGLNEFVEYCRENFERPIPYFENVLGSTWVVGDQEIFTSTYKARFEAALEHLERAIDELSYNEALSAVTMGIASVEALLSDQAEKGNAGHPSSALNDSRENKVSFDDRIDQWIPLMTGGQRLNKDGFWGDFKILRGIRDDTSIHPKERSYTRSIRDIADIANRFRTGIALFLIGLHNLFDLDLPANVVRAYYAVDVEVEPIETVKLPSSNPD
jgi:hypothetical protein